jgi:hypothetical protein
VLFEQSAGEEGCGLAEGYTSQYIRVRARACPGELRPVRLQSAEGTLVLGEAVEME